MAKDDKKAPAITLVAVNRRATFDYELTDRFEAGIALTGTEVKVLRSGKADLTDGWVSLDQGQPFLRGVSIPVLQGSPYTHEPKRARKLLLHTREIEQLQRGIEREGMTVTVTKLYFKGPHAKVEVALAKGKKAYDKRETMKRKEADKEARQAISSAVRRRER